MGNLPDNESYKSTKKGSSRIEFYETFLHSNAHNDQMIFGGHLNFVLTDAVMQSNSQWYSQTLSQTFAVKKTANLLIVRPKKLANDVFFYTFAF